MMGHGHVTPNPDGSKARCGGPAICPECAREEAQLRNLLQAPKPPAPVATPPGKEEILRQAIVGAQAVYAKAMESAERAMNESYSVDTTISAGLLDTAVRALECIVNASDKLA